MSLYHLTPKPGYERYTIQVGWNPGRTFYANVMDDTWDSDTNPGIPEPISVHLGMGDPILDSDVVIAAIAGYAVISAMLADSLRCDQASRPRPHWAII